jgi:hypothetical protein
VDWKDVKKTLLMPMSYSIAGDRHGPYELEKINGLNSISFSGGKQLKEQGKGLKHNLKNLSKQNLKNLQVHLKMKKLVWSYCAYILTLGTE